MKSLATDLTIYAGLALLLAYLVPGIVITRWVARRLFRWDIDLWQPVGRRNVTC